MQMHALAAIVALVILVSFTILVWATDF